jgi:hypothetical protein
MTDREYAEFIEAEADKLLARYCAMADDVYLSVLRHLRRGAD